jgi:hypothetical protein
MGRSEAWSEWRERKVAAIVRRLGIFIKRSVLSGNAFDKVVFFLGKTKLQGFLGFFGGGELGGGEKAKVVRVKLEA